jgi:hypothetical protein
MTTPKIPQMPDEQPQPGPKGPRTPYPANEPPLPDPGAEPDFIPATPDNPPGKI